MNVTYIKSIINYIMVNYDSKNIVKNGVENDMSKMLKVTKISEKSQEAVLKMTVEGLLASWIRNMVTISAFGIVIYNLDINRKTKDIAKMLIISGLSIGISAVIMYLFRIKQIFEKGYIEYDVERMGAVVVIVTVMFLIGLLVIYLNL